MACAIEGSIRCRPYKDSRPISIVESYILKQARLTCVVEDPPEIEAIKGIQPLLEYIVQRDNEAEKRAEDLVESSTQSFELEMVEQQALVPDDGVYHFSIDPHHLDGWVCKNCTQELSNLYFRCYGCRMIEKECYFCAGCFFANKHLSFIPMNEAFAKEQNNGALHHVGHIAESKPGSLPESERNCHRRFERDFRWGRPSMLNQLVEECRSFLGGDSLLGEPSKTLEYLKDAEKSVKLNAK